MLQSSHNRRSYRKKSCLSLQDIAEILDTIDFSQIARHEKSPIAPQIQIAILYNLLFGIPFLDFFPTEVNALKKKITLRIPNIIDELKCNQVTPLISEKISFLSSILSNLNNNPTI